MGNGRWGVWGWAMGMGEGRVGRKIGAKKCCEAIGLEEGARSDGEMGLKRLGEEMLRSAGGGRWDEGMLRGNDEKARGKQ